MRIRTRRVAVSVFLAMASAAPVTGQCSLGGDLDGNGVVDGADLGLLLIQWGQECTAAIDAVTPASGPVSGGTAITISGRNLGVVQSVTVGGVPATLVENVDSSTITAVTPAGKSAGFHDVVVTTSAQAATLSEGFFYYDETSWATVLEELPDPAVITDQEWRDRIVATGLPWRVRDNVSGIEMLLVPHGMFDMGCTPSAGVPCIPDESPVHQVTLTQAYYLGRYEVTQSQWSAIMGSNPSYFQTATSQVSEEEIPNRPVEQVSWNMIQEFEAVTGLRLPTEAEWEHACRAGTDTAYNLPPDGTDADSDLVLLGWYYHNAASQTRPVGQRLANNLGLHDMHGNVDELCEDWYDAEYYLTSPTFDPTGPDSGSSVVYRGGGWSEDWRSHRSSKRRNFWGHAAYPSTARNTLGFRVARHPF
jgi:formylglycine-generating enzyme required for sulfatase activity